MSPAIRCEFKKLFQKREFWILILLGVILGGAAYCELLPYYSQVDSSATLTATRAFMLWPNSGIGQMYILCLIPLFGSIAYSDCYFSECKNGSQILYITRMDRKPYYYSKLIVVAVSALLITILPLVINQLLCLIAYPLKEFSSYYTGSVYDIQVADELRRVIFPNLYMNSPLMSNIIQVFFVGVFGAVSGILSYAITLHYQKNYLIAVGSTTILNLILLFGFQLIGLQLLTPYEYFNASPYTQGRNPYFFLGMMIALMLISSFLIVKKIRRKKDILS